MLQEIQGKSRAVENVLICLFCFNHFQNKVADGTTIILVRVKYVQFMQPSLHKKTFLFHFDLFLPQIAMNEYSTHNCMFYQLPTSDNYSFHNGLTKLTGFPVREIINASVLDFEAI